MVKKLWRSPWFWSGTVFLLALVLFVALALHYTSPAKVRKTVLAYGAKAVNGTFEIGDARVQVFRGARLYDIRLARPNQSQPDIGIDYVRCDWNPAAFLHGDIEPRRVVLVEPTIRLLVDERRHTNLEDLFKAESSDTLGDLMKYERYFSEGIFAESAKLLWHAPVFFGDDRTRVFSEIDIEMHRPSETLTRWNLSALVRGAPLEGMRIEGWMDFAPKKERISYKGEVEELDIRPDMFAYLPAHIREYMIRFDMKGKFSASTRIDYRRGEPVTHAVEVSFHNLDARLRPTDLEARSLDACVRFDSVGFSCDDVSGIMWSGAFSGGAAGRPDVPVTAWLKLEQADLERLAKEVHLDQPDLRGVLDLAMRFQVPKENPSKWTAEGTADVRKAYLAKLPLFVRAFKLLKFQFPGGEVFDQGDCRFSIRDDTIYVESMNISSPSAEITVTGTIGLDGETDLVMLIAGTQRERGWLVTLPIRAVIRGIERQISPPVAITGPLRDPEVRILAMEPVKRSLRNLADLLPFVGE